MTPTTLTTSAITAVAMLMTLTLPLAAFAQGSHATRNLRLGESTGQPRGYAFLLPMPPKKGSLHEVFLQLKPESTNLSPEQWTWKVDGSTAQIASMLTFKWYAQAACPDDLTLLQVAGPAGTLTQNPLSNPIWGNFSTQSFTVDTVKNVCKAWADATSCDPAEPGCQLYETFDLVAGVAPASPADLLHLKASCVSGPLPTIDYAAKVRLRCTRGNF